MVDNDNSNLLQLLEIALEWTIKYNAFNIWKDEKIELNNYVEKNRNKNKNRKFFYSNSAFYLNLRNL